MTGIRSKPREMSVARYKDGRLIQYEVPKESKPIAAKLIAEIKETCARCEIDRAAHTGSRSVHKALSAARDALDNLGQEHGLSPDGEHARDLCGAALESIERSRGVSGQERATGKGDAVARAIERVRQKEDEERKASERGHGREQGRE